MNCVLLREGACKAERLSATEGNERSDGLGRCDCSRWLTMVVAMVLSVVGGGRGERWVCGRAADV